jgi:4-amino-4-deoxy-L-arabinose transferase-like glycosyltransferase
VGETRGVPAGTAANVRARALGAVALPGWSGAAWGAIGVTLLFIGLTCWWLAVDRAMPYSDASVHLSTAFTFHDQLRDGDLLGPFEYRFIYPPLTPFVGALGIFIGGRNVAAPIVTENLVYVPLLALGCYHVGRLAFSRQAGLLAVVFALGAPLIAEQFHVFMIDAPLAALVATAVWLVLASDRFRRRDLALAAGIVTGLGMISKQSFPLYLAGLIVIVLVRGGGWRNVRGLALFALGAILVAGPWYGYQHTILSDFAEVAGAGATVPALARPPLLTRANFEWYFWALVNGLLFVPLLAFATVGVASAAARTALRRTRGAGVPELLGGLAGAWLALTVMPHHDVRYTEPLIVYLAVLGTGWIVLLRPYARAAATAALGLAVIAATLGATFGVGHPSNAILPGNREGPLGEGVPPLRHWTVYANTDFMVSGPRRAGDILGLLEAMRADGVRQVAWSAGSAPLWYVDFNHHGLLTFTQIAELEQPNAIDTSRLRPEEVFLLFGSLPGDAPPCVQLREHAGVWALRGEPRTGLTRYYCPRPRPRYYG